MNPDTKQEVILAPFDHTDLSEVADDTKWSREQLEGELAKRALHKSDYPTHTGEWHTYDKAVDVLTFELKMRTGEGL